MPKRYPGEVRERAVRIVLERLGDYRSVWAACQDLAPKLDIGVESLRQWVVQAQADADADAGDRAGPTSEDLEEIRRLKREVRDLKEANEILRSASIFFARELDPRPR